jgi:hypothetical protein
MRSSQFDAITTSVWYDEADSTWYWRVKVGEHNEREGWAGTRKTALDKVNDVVEESL